MSCEHTYLLDDAGAGVCMTCGDKKRFRLHAETAPRTDWDDREGDARIEFERRTMQHKMDRGAEKQDKQSHSWRLNGRKR